MNGSLNVPTTSVNSNSTINAVDLSTPQTPPSEDKPLNLSSSKVLHTSNQHIIDHFIDKLLSSGTDGKNTLKYLFRKIQLSFFSKKINSQVTTRTLIFPCHSCLHHLHSTCHLCRHRCNHLRPSLLHRPRILVKRSAHAKGSDTWKS